MIYKITNEDIKQMIDNDEKTLNELYDEILKYIRNNSNLDDKEKTLTSCEIFLKGTIKILELPGEIWKKIPGYEEYQASNLGRIRCLNFNKIKGNVQIVSQAKSGKGYLGVHLRGKSKSVHRIVALTFLPIPKDIENPEVNHIDENKENNRVFSNLEWVSHKANINHGTRTARSAETQTYKRAVLQFDLNGKFKGKWNSARDAAIALFGKPIISCNILKCCRGEIKKAHGWVWKFAS